RRGRATADAPEASEKPKVATSFSTPTPGRGQAEKVRGFCRSFAAAARVLARRGDGAGMRIWIATLAALLALHAVALAEPREPVTDSRPVVVEVSRGGFDWPDALIGASAASGAWLAAGGAVASRRPSQGTSWKDR